MAAPELYPFQRDMIDQIRAARARGARIIVVQAPTGSGKTTLFCYMVLLSYLKERYSLCLVHRRRLVNQIGSRLAQFEIPYDVLMRGDEAINRFPVTVASRDTLLSRCVRNSWVDLPRADLVVVDECFPAGTLVDKRCIEAIKIGDLVNSWNHTTNCVERREVTRVFRSTPSALVTVTFRSGRKIVCTPGHPFFLPNCGCYSPAIGLESGSMVLTVTKQGEICHEKAIDRNLLALWSKSRGDVADEEGQLQEVRTSLLLRGSSERVSTPDVFNDDGCDESDTCFGSHEGQEPNESCRCSGQGVSFDAIGRSQANRARRQRHRHDRSRTVSCCCAWVGAYHCADWACPRWKRLSNALQAGHRQCRFEDWDRDRWPEPLHACSQSTRQEKDSLSGVDWVDSVEIHQPASAREFGSLCPDGYVYNLEVEGNHNYFANGVLVHNCHHCAGQSEYREILARYPQATILLVSATPVGSDGLGLGPWAQAIVCAPPITQLIRDEYLVPIKCYAPARKTNRGKLLRGIAGDLVGSWLDYAEGRPTVLFTSRVEHSKDAVQAFQAEGITAVHIDASTPDDVRDRVFDDVAAGRTKVLANVAVVGEGVDVPELGCCQVYCEINSRVGWLQRIGRIMRPSPGKDYGILIDHAGAIFRLGWPDEDQEWPLAGNVDADYEARRDNGDLQPTGWCKHCQIAYKGTVVCPQCGRAPVKPPPSPFEAAPVRPRHEILTEADRQEDRGVWARDEQIKHWLRCLAVAKAKNGTPGQAAMIFKQKYKRFPGNDFPCMPRSRDEWRTKVAELWPDFGKRKAVADGGD
jgi:superfamily II DNA or RNA helicase